MKNELAYNLILGSHIGFHAPEYFLGAVKESLSMNENAFMFYTGAPQNTKRIPYDKYNFDEGKEEWLSHHHDLTNIIVHCPYIINPASPDVSKQTFAIDFIVQDIKRLAKMGLKYYVLHPGKYMDSDLQSGIRSCAYVLNEVNRITKGLDVVICLETMAGTGTEIATKFINVGDIIKQVKDQNRVGVCIDTCHIWDAGYNIHDPDNVLKQFDNAIGINFLKCMHINDSKNDQFSHKDRHENIGYGKIGFETIIKWIYHPKTNAVIKILETPYYDSKAPYKKEIEMIKSRKFEDWKNE